MQINPVWQEAFRQELANNLGRVSNNFTRQLVMKDLWEECIMYSCDMCLHYYKTGPFKGLLPDTIDNVTYNVCMALKSMVPEFVESQHQVVFDKVKELLKDSNTYETLQDYIDNYYGR